MSCRSTKLSRAAFRVDLLLESFDRPRAAELAGRFGPDHESGGARSERRHLESGHEERGEEKTIGRFRPHAQAASVADGSDRLRDERQLDFRGDGERRRGRASLVRGSDLLPDVLDRRLTARSPRGFVERR